MSQGDVERGWLSLDPSDRRTLIPAAWMLLQTESDPIDRHFTYNHLEEALYRSRDDFPGALDEFDLACEAHDAEMATIRPALLTDFERQLPRIPMYRQQSIRQAKARAYAKALWWAERGLVAYASAAHRPANVEDLKKRAARARDKLESEDGQALGSWKPKLNLQDVPSLVADMVNRERDWLIDPSPPEQEEEQGTVPLWDGYYPTLESAEASQKDFYEWMTSEFEQGRTPDVEGQLAYLFVRIYDVVNGFIETRDYAAMASQFDFLRFGYGDTTKIGTYLDLWQSNAALLSERYEDAWEMKRGSRLSVDYVLNVRSRCEDTTLNALDLHSLLLSDTGLTSRGAVRIKAVNGVVDRLLDEHHASSGRNVVDATVAAIADRRITKKEFADIAAECDHVIGEDELQRLYQESAARSSTQEIYLFPGVAMSRLNPSVVFKSVSPFVEAAVLARAKSLMRRAENEVRRREGLPAIGEGWVGETELLRLIERTFPHERVVQHARPEWLSPQHLDIYLPDNRVALEYQGAQHVRPVDYFGGEEAFADQQERDARKKRLCDRNNCTLLYVYEGYRPDDVVREVTAALKRRRRLR